MKDEQTNKLTYLIHLRNTFTYSQILEVGVLLLLWYFAAHWIFYIWLVLSILSLFIMSDKILKLEKEAGVNLKE